MKNSKLKIILPIVLIPAVMVMIVVGYILYMIYGYQNDFKNSISEKEILKYLQEKYDGDFTDIKLIGSYKSKYQR